MKNKPKIKSISFAAIRTISFYPGKRKCTFAMLGTGLSVIKEETGWSCRLAKKKCLKKFQENENAGKI